MEKVTVIKQFFVKLAKAFLIIYLKKKKIEERQIQIEEEVRNLYWEIYFGNYKKY